MTISFCFSGENLSCVRGERIIFSRLSFFLNSGEALLLVGPNGSGKSSLLRILAGLLQPSTGNLFRNNRSIKKMLELHTSRIRYVGHLDGIKPTISVVETLIFISELSGTRHHIAVESAVSAMRCLNLSHLANIPGRLLSAGQRRKTCLARLLLGFSDLWLLDEPTTSLDKTAVFALSKMITEHRDKGGAVILSTNTTVDLPIEKKLDMRDFTLDPP